MKTISAWTVRPKYVKFRKKKKTIYINGLITCRDEEMALKLADEYHKTGLEATSQFEELQINEPSDED